MKRSLYFQLTRRVLKLAPVVLAFFFLAVETAQARGALVFKFGWFSPAGESQLWEDNLETFDFQLDDFNYVMGGVELGIELKELLDVTIGFDGYSRRVSSQYRDFVREDGTEIEQDFQLKIFPITGGFRFLPLGKFHKFIPYVAAGGALYYFDYQEEGEFIDFGTFDVFSDTFRDSGLTLGGYAGAGLEFLLSEGIDEGQGWFVFAEFRRHWVGVELAGDFKGDQLDLGGYQWGFGVSLRF